MWKLIHSSNKQVKEITKEIRKLLKMSKKENTRQHNLQAAAKAMLGEKFIAINAYIKIEITKQTKHMANQ